MVVFISTHLLLLTILPLSSHLTSIPWWELGHIWGRSKWALISRLYSMCQIQVTKLIGKRKSHKWKVENPEGFRTVTWGRTWGKDKTSRKECMKKHAYRKDENCSADIKTNINLIGWYEERFSDVKKNLAKTNFWIWSWLQQIAFYWWVLTLGEKLQKEIAETVSNKLLWKLR